MSSPPKIWEALEQSLDYLRRAPLELPKDVRRRGWMAMGPANLKAAEMPDHRKTWTLTEWKSRWRPIFIPQTSLCADKHPSPLIVGWSILKARDAGPGSWNVMNFWVKLLVKDNHFGGQVEETWLYREAPGVCWSFVQECSSRTFCACFTLSIYWYIYLYVYIYTYVCIRICQYMYMYMYTYTYMYMYMYLYMYMYIYIYICTHTHPSVENILSFYLFLHSTHTWQPWPLWASPARDLIAVVIN